MGGRARVPRGNPPVTLAQNLFHMKSKFPALVARASKGKAVWRGPLQPSEDSALYTVCIHWREGDRPRVYVEDPPLAAGAPHLYEEGNLCLYFPADRTWHRGRLISDTIVPLTAEWLLFYEFWLLTGVWYGPEAPHPKSDRKTFKH